MSLSLDQNFKFLALEVFHNEKYSSFESVIIQLLKIDDILVLKVFHVLKLPLNLIEYFFVSSPCNFDCSILFIASFLESADDSTGPFP